MNQNIMISHGEWFSFLFPSFLYTTCNLFEVDPERKRLRLQSVIPDTSLVETVAARAREQWSVLPLCCLELGGYRYNYLGVVIFTCDMVCY